MGAQLLARALAVAAASSIGLVLACGTANAQTPPSYFPHWVIRAGEDFLFQEGRLDSLPPDAVIGVHHSWSIPDLRKFLDFPGKSFRLSWYVESNICEGDDDKAGVPIKDRIAEARAKQDTLLSEPPSGRQRHSADRFTNEIELDASRDRYEAWREGELKRRCEVTNTNTGKKIIDKRTGKRMVVDDDQSVWDHAKNVRDFGFRYIAKSPAPSFLDEMRKKFGERFVSRVVFEDVADNDPTYRSDARTIAATGIPLTLVIHRCNYAGGDGTTFKDARKVVQIGFNLPNVEAYQGQPTDFNVLKTFSGEFPDRRNVDAARSTCDNYK